MQAALGQAELPHFQAFEAGIPEANLHLFAHRLEAALNTVYAHSIRRYRIFVVDDSDVAKPKSFDQRSHDLVMWDRVKAESSGLTSPWCVISEDRISPYRLAMGSLS